MNKRVIIYLRNEEILNKFKKDPDRADVVNKLIEDYYSSDIDYIRQKKELVTQELAVLDLKIKNYEKKQELVRKQKEQERKLEEANKKRELLKKKLIILWREEKIADNDYYRICKIKDVRKMEDQINGID